MSQFDRIWCLEYDEDSFHRSMVKINFSRYLNTILSNPYFSAFQNQASKQLSNQSEWNQRSWSLLQMFQYFNKAFATQQFESNVKFIADKNTRRIFGSFRMWIDLQRLYLLTFLKMDRIQFQEDRIYFSLYRTLFFLCDLLTEYQIGDFRRQFLDKIKNKIDSYTSNLQRSLPVYMHIILKYIRQLIPNFIRKLGLIDSKQKEDIRKMTFRKLSRQYDMMSQVIQRLNNNMQFQTKQRQVKQIQNIAQSSLIQSMTKKVQHLYDPRIRFVQALKIQSQETNKPYDQKKVDELLKSYLNKQKQKVPSETPYQSLLRTGHNPYDESNYAIYGQTLRVDMNEKQNLQKKQQLSQIQQEEIESNAQYYDPGYIQKVKKIQINSVAVTQKDLNNRAIQQERDRHYSQDNSILLRNLQWNQNLTNRNDHNLYSNDQDNDDKDKGNPASTLRSINLKKNLQNNALFQKFDEQQKQKSLYFLKKVIRSGIQSDVLYGLQQKSLGLYSQMNNKKMINLNTKSTIDRSKFDSLRKVAQFHAINKKLTTWINMNKIPGLYPRGIEQIKKYYVDTSLVSKKLQLALQSLKE